ncbi:HNH endonuclease signature motif containing protein [Caulobacter segnis]|uniref:HNH endonuclease n=1 Tax=Caulobacter segnis TaxID=88688 RepID=A0A2W5XFI4_9CAUL|nr:HNH endonuclease signature motif containing protein [Caulobacter segnis]PZR36451.1 MAG: hypothetical protein DI526_03165 [Caulobacter segnis]
MRPEVTIIPEREPVAANTAPRRPLTRAEYLQLCLDQNGRCACGCGVKLDAIREKVIDEHRIPRALGGSDALDNRELWRKPCSDKKTREADLPAIAKAKRLNGETGQNRRSKPIKSAGFSNRTRKFDGSVGPTKKAARAAKEQC